ncbi:uncharacterized protein CCOS01_15530 [Colletotrichum costaricense]|uniref:Uncharacterized protein n=1 Tax=Colletotrichum costaricense TaxID=1209916 RepID=A0AAI9YHK2_9PEZI|nr:uncharacterized protein CCOS01_15530 [Colletotrichum costaricense]KAK1509436.1 hypothetical protein CCOS01_15530 [Colletotrichum costaricense]
MSGSRLKAQSKGRAKLCIRWNVEFPDESGQQDAASSPRAMAPMGKKESTRDPADQGQGWRGRLGCHRCVGASVWVPAKERTPYKRYLVYNPAMPASNYNAPKSTNPPHEDSQ